jgi:hypothetical protein
VWQKDKSTGKTTDGSMHDYSSTSSPSNTTGSSSSRDHSTNSSHKAPGFSIKGLYLGMSKDDAVNIIKSLCAGRVEVNDQKFMELNGGHGKCDGLQILLKDKDGNQVMGGVGGLLLDPKGRTVECFFFEQGLTDYLFNTGDLTAKEFAQQFINSYDVPTLAPSNFSNRQCWAYTSPEGWTVRLSDDKLVSVSRTPRRKFD